MKRYCVTGHRPNKLVYTTNIGIDSNLINFATKQIRTCDYIITGMALGWDMAVAIACIESNVPFTAAIPFIGQELCWPELMKSTYNSILEKADKIYVVNPGGYAAWKMQKRNEYMVDNSEGVIALWDGSSSGTGNCVNYAKKVGKPVKNLWDDWIAFNTRNVLTY